jgi:predicted dinucleotide-binding enzyme
MKHIGIIGAGYVGEALASRLVETGHEVKVANSRGRDSLRAFAQRTGAEAVDIGDLPKTVSQTLPQSAIVVDAGNYWPLRDGAITAIDQAWRCSVRPASL